MNLNYIREFVVLTRTGRFQDAADQLFLSQPTLSKHIMALEKDLGHDLLVRAKKQKLQLTPFGKSFLPYALQLTASYDDLERELLKKEDGCARRIVIGSSPIVPLYTVFEFLDGFLRENPDDFLQIIDGTGPQLFDLLRTGQCSLIVAQEPAGGFPVDCRHILYKEDHLSVLLPKEHPLASRQTVSFEQLRDEKLIQLSPSELDDLIGELSQKAGFPVKELIAVTRPSIVVDLVENHMGVSVMPRFPAQHFSGGRLAVADLEPEVPVHYHIVYPAGKNLPASTRALLAYIGA